MRLSTFLTAIPSDQAVYCSNAGISRIAWNPWLWTLLTATVVCTIFLGKSDLTYWFNLDHSKTLPYPITNFVGRTAEMEDLNHLMDANNQDIRIVSIVGSPGFGKSTLAIQAGHSLVQQGFIAAYVNMIEVSSVQALPEKILDSAEIKTKKPTTDRLLKWAKDLSYPTVMIFDNCDDILHRQKNELQELTKKLLQSSSKLKLLMTSRQRTMQLAQFRLFPLHELSREASCTLLQRVVKDLDQSVCETITNLTGNVPLALRVVGSILSLPDPPTPMTLVNDLKDHLMATLSPEELPDNDRVNISISLSYQYLSRQAQKIGRYLANFPGSFDRKAACEILLYIQYHNHDTGCDKFMDVHLKMLVQRSLLEHNRRSNRYQFHCLIREFFIGVQKSIGEKGVREEKRFAISFQWYYSNVLQSLVHQFSDDYADTLHTLDSERHNIEKLFLNFNFIATTNHHTVALATATAVEVALGARLLHYRFSAEELTVPISEIVTYLKYNLRAISGRITCQDYMEVYVNLLTSLADFESGTEKALKRLEEQQSWIESLDLYIPAGRNRAALSYTKFYSILADYYATLGKYNAASKCHVMILKKKKALSDCHPGSCDYYHIGIAYYHLGNYQQSIYFLELMVKETHLNLFSTAAVLITLQKAYESLNGVDSANEATKKMLALVPELTNAEYGILIKHENTILGIIDLFVKIGKIDEAYVLKEKLWMAKKEVGHDVTFEGINIAKFLFSNKKFVKAAEIGKFVLKDLQQLSAKTEKAFTDSKLRLLQLIGMAEYYNGNSSESVEYLGQLVEMVCENYTSATTEEFADAHVACIFTTIQGQPILGCVKIIAIDIKNLIHVWYKFLNWIPVGVVDWNIEKHITKEQEETLRTDEALRTDETVVQNLRPAVYSKSLISRDQDDIYGLTVYTVSKVFQKLVADLFQKFVADLFQTFVADLLVAIFAVCKSMLNALLEFVYVRYAVNIAWILFKTYIFILFTCVLILFTCVLIMCCLVCPGVPIQIVFHVCKKFFGWLVRK